MEVFKPHVIVSQLGVDTFVGDPLASLELTTYGFSQVIDYLTENAPAWVALGGGGYNMSNVARAWTLAWAIMNGIDLPDELPEEITGSRTTGLFRGQTLRDDKHKGPRQRQCKEHMETCLAYLEKNVVSLIS
jgi:acetoin utilization protein AcuC